MREWTSIGERLGEVVFGCDERLCKDTVNNDQFHQRHIQLTTIPSTETQEHTDL